MKIFEFPGAQMIDDLPMTRARLYVLVDAFERDIREALERFVVSEIGERACLASFYSEAERKRNDDPAGSDTPLVTFLGLREGYDLLNTHRALLPSEFSVEVRELTANLDRISAIRNRVMHARPLAAGDNDAAVSLLSQFQSRNWRGLHHTLAKLRSDPLWEPITGPIIDSSKALHNLPLPDYDDTGLVGREKEVQDLVALLKRGREPVITITGEGGIGKTALALEVAYRLVDDPESPFEAVLWASLKFEKLTAFGVRQIAGAARDIIGAVQPAGAVVDTGFAGTLEDLSALLDGFNILLVLDNMETVSGEEFRALYNTMPDTISYLVTSRIGVGEYERRYALGALNDKDSLQLFSQFVRARRITSLSRLASEVRINVVKELRYSPLAIKWFALAVEAGKNPLDLIRHQDELLEFCVRSVYSDLSDSAREVLDALAVLARPMPTDELVVLLDRPIDAISAGVQELLRGSMVRQEHSGASENLVFHIVLTETATHFLGRRVQPSANTKEKLEARDREFREIQERRELDMASRSLAPVVVRQRTSSDASICTVLRQALIMAQKGAEADQVYEKLDLARRIDPDFWEVDRVEGFIRDSYGDVPAATSSYERAYSNAVGDDRAVVAYFFAGHLARKARDLNRAIPYAQEAHDVLGLGETGMALGNFKIWSNNFLAGIALLEAAVPQTSGKTRVIALSALAEGWRRRAESSGEQDKNFLEQYSHALQGFKIASAAIETGIADSRLRGTATDCAAIVIKAAAVCARSRIRIPNLAEDLAVVQASLERLVGAAHWSALGAAADQLVSSGGAPVTAQRLRAVIVRLSETERPDESDDLLSSMRIGEVVNLVDGYGFIRHLDFPSNLFFHANTVGSEGGFNALRTGMAVRFTAENTDRGYRATEVISTLRE